MPGAVSFGALCSAGANSLFDDVAAPIGDAFGSENLTPCRPAACSSGDLTALACAARADGFGGLAGVVSSATAAVQASVETRQAMPIRPSFMDSSFTQTVTRSELPPMSQFGNRPEVTGRNCERRR